MTDLGSFGGTVSTASTVNASGQVVGGSTTGDPPFPIPGQGMVSVERAFLWERGVLNDLGTLTGGVCCSGASDINAAGEIVGSGLTADFETHATLWTRK